MKESFKFIFSRRSLCSIIVAIISIVTPIITSLGDDNNFSKILITSVTLGLLFSIIGALPAVFYLKLKNIESLGGYLFTATIVSLVFGVVTGFFMIFSIPASISSFSNFIGTILTGVLMGGFALLLPSLIFSSIFWMGAINRKYDSTAFIFFASSSALWWLLSSRFLSN